MLRYKHRPMEYSKVDEGLNFTVTIPLPIPPFLSYTLLNSPSLRTFSVLTCFSNPPLPTSLDFFLGCPYSGSIQHDLQLPSLIYTPRSLPFICEPWLTLTIKHPPLQQVCCCQTSGQRHTPSLRRYVRVISSCPMLPINSVHSIRWHRRPGHGACLWTPASRSRTITCTTQILCETGRSIKEATSSPLVVSRIWGACSSSPLDA